MWDCNETGNGIAFCILLVCIMAQIKRGGKTMPGKNKANFEIVGTLFLAHAASVCDYFNNQYSLK